MVFRSRCLFRVDPQHILEDRVKKYRFQRTKQWEKLVSLQELDSAKTSNTITENDNVLNSRSEKNEESTIATASIISKINKKRSVPYTGFELYSIHLAGPSVASIRSWMTQSEEERHQFRLLAHQHGPNYPEEFTHTQLKKLGFFEFQLPQLIEEFQGSQNTEGTPEDAECDLGEKLDKLWDKLSPTEIKQFKATKTTPEIKKMFFPAHYLRAEIEAERMFASQYFLAKNVTRWMWIRSLLITWYNEEQNRSHENVTETN
eukprot:PhF_6_TR1419/c0_g1_i1/m.2490